MNEELARSIRCTARLCKNFYTDTDMDSKQQKNLQKAVKKWAKQAANETILAWAWNFNWLGVYDGSSGFLVTDQAVYGYENFYHFYFPFKGLYKVSEDNDRITTFYQDGTEQRSSFIDSKFLKDLMEILKDAARVNRDYFLEQQRENRQNCCVCASWDFYRHIYRFKDSEFAVLCAQHEDDDVGDWKVVYFRFREIHEGWSGGFRIHGSISDTEDGFYSPHEITFFSGSPFPWMEEKILDSSGRRKNYHYAEKRNTDFLFEIVGDVVCAGYPGGEVCVYEGKRFPFSPERGTKTELAKLAPGDNVYVYIDEKQTAHIVYSVHTSVLGRNRSYPINHDWYGSVDKFYEKAFAGYHIDEYELLGKGEDAHKWYKI